MFDSITATGVVASATLWVAEVYPVILIVMGLGLLFTLANWVVAKFRQA